MAEPHSNARPRAHPGAPTSGVIHVRTRLTANFTVVANALAQRRGSAVTVGIAVYILSLPDGAPVSIAALCAHFTEGEILVSRALRDLEADGYLERRRERTTGGLVRTRTYAYDAPGQRWPGPRPRPATPAPLAPPVPPAPQAPATPPATEPAELPATRPAAPHATPHADRGAAPPPLAEADPRAVAVLTSLRRHDPRLLLSERDVAGLAPDVAEWLARGVGAMEVIRHLTAGLPKSFRARPARFLAFRLAQTPVAPAESPVTRAVLPWQTCDGGCERAFRATRPGRCRDCASTDPATAPRNLLGASC